MSAAEIKQAIARLNPDEVSELLSWLSHYHGLVWNLKTAGDPAAERFEELLRDLQMEIEEEVGELSGSRGR